MNRTIVIYLFRHGQTDWNLAGKIQGHADIPLNATGEEQALELADLLRPYSFSTIYCSDLQRAQKTAQIIGEQHGCFVSPHFALREANLGLAEGLTYSEVKKRFGELFWSFQGSDSANFWDFSYPEGESRRAVVQRVLQFMQTLEESSCAIATHGGVIRLLLLYLTQQQGVSVADIPIPNCALYKLSYSADRVEYQLLGSSSV